MSAVVAEAGPWIMLAAVLYLIYRWCERQDRLEAERERRYQERMRERYRRLEFDDPYVDDGGEQLLPFPIRVDKDVPPGYVELHDEDGIVKRIGPFSPHPNVDARPE